MKRKTVYVIIALALFAIWSMNSARDLSNYQDNSAAALAALGE